MVLTVIVLTQLLFALDVSVVTVALPRIGAEFGLDVVAQSWIQTAYVVAFGGLLLLGGRVGDVLGRRRALGVGVGLFTAASVAGGLAPSGGWLIAGRALQGVGAALASPNAMALLMLTHPAGVARNRALAVFSAVIGTGGALGLVVSGVLTTTASWRWGLLLNLPVGLAVLALAPRRLPETDRTATGLDLSGVALSATGVAALVIGLTDAAQRGWGGFALGAIGVAVALSVAFVLVERRATAPVLPLGLLADRVRGGGYLAEVLACGAMFGVFFLLTQYQQEVLGFDALHAGLGFLPLMVAQVATARLVPRLLARFRPAALVVLGAGLITAAVLWLSRLHAGSTWLLGVAGPMVVLGFGGAVTFVSLSSLILAEVPPEHAGAAAGALQVAQYAGTALGVAALVGVFATAQRAGVDLAGALAVAVLGAVPFALAVAALGASGARARKSLLGRR